MELLLGAVLGLIAGLLAGVGLMLLRAVPEQRRRRAAVDAELAAARQRAERATAEVQALRTRLAAADARLALLPAVEKELGAARQEVAALRGPAAGRTAGRARPAAVPGPVPVLRATSRAPAPVGQRQPDVRGTPPPAPPPVPVRAPAPVLMPAPTETPGRLTIEAPVASPQAPDPIDAEEPPAAERPHPHGWTPVRRGLSDPYAWLGTTAPNGRQYREDDLQRIHGVGPYLAKRLRVEGVLTWRQVAEWDDDDMTLVSRRIGSFPDRIRREDWPGSARVLHEEVYGETLP